MKRLGWSVIALGAVQFTLAFARPCTIDVLGIVLVLAGLSVRNGSRAGAVVALVGCVLAALLASAGLAEEFQKVGTWLTSAAEIVLGAWALLNAILLARARPAPLNEQGVQADPNDRRPVLQFSIRSLLVVMLAVRSRSDSASGMRRNTHHHAVRPSRRSSPGIRNNWQG